MKFLTFLYQGRQHAGVLSGGEVTPIEEINARHGTAIPNDLLEIIRAGIQVPDDYASGGARRLPLDLVQPQLPMVF